MRTVKFLLNAVAVLSALLLAAGVVLFLLLASSIPRLPDDLRLLATSPATEIYARDGELMGTVGGRDFVSIDQISPHFLNAAVAVEDRRFHRHHGLDRLALVRALWQNAVHLGDAPGGSTITQQLAKNLFFTFKRSWKRKLLEAMAAVAIEDRFSKDEILETYCNFIYFGQYAYGVERAALTFFGRHASELELQQAALLAGLPNAPARFNPYNHPERAKARRRVVLKAMARSNYIPPEAVDSIAALPLRLSQQTPSGKTGSFAVDWALAQAGDAVGADVAAYGGIRIHTTIEPRLQSLAERTLKSGVAALEEKLKPADDSAAARLEGALAAVEVRSGEVLALAGGRDYRESPFNRALSANRQVGSAFKPVLYLAALEAEDITPATLFTDQPVKIPIGRGRTWSPVNFDGRYRGRMVAKWALMKSVNTVAAQVMSITGPEAVVRTARRLGVKSELRPLYSLALGAQGVSPLEMATVYASIAREGEYLESRVLRRIESAGGAVLRENLAAPETRFAPEPVYQLVDMLQGVLDNGTGSIVRRRGFSGAGIGKTGTTNDYRDAWFVGATPLLAVAVWVGYDDNRPLRLRNGVGVTGAVGAAPIWTDFMNRAAISGSGDFPKPPDLVRVYVELNSGELVAGVGKGVVALFLTPEEVELLHTKPAPDSTATDK